MNAFNVSSSESSSFNQQESSSATKSVSWYNQKLRERHQVELYDFEQQIVTNAEQDIFGDKDVVVQVNRSYQEFQNLQNESAFKAVHLNLILGSGERHQGKRYRFNYTVDSEESAEPDLVASINNPVAMGSLPTASFTRVIWEYLPGDVLLNTHHFREVYRILKPGGAGYLPVPLQVFRTLPFIIEETPFKGQMAWDHWIKDVTYSWVTSEESIERVSSARALELKEANVMKLTKSELD